jgi:ribonucleoside-diphosphate reductase alpha chain
VIAILDDRARVHLTPSGEYMLRFRYLERDARGEFVDPVDLFRRVAWNLADAERVLDPTIETQAHLAWADRFFRAMTRFEFLPNAPTLLAAGRVLQQLHACFVLPVEDSIGGIFEALRLAAIVHSKGGGTGFSFSRVRGRGEAIATGGVSTGVVSFMRLFDHETEIIKQGGTGWGANMGVLRFDHPDIDEFISAKSAGNGLRNFNLSVAVTDAFMRDAESGEPYADALLRRIAAEAWKTGDPGLLFLDRIERDNPTPALGALEATNPCGEAPLLPFEACCLGGLNVAAFVDPVAKTIRWDDLRAAAALAVRMLDNVIEMSRYPVPEIADATRRTRKIGIGIMGFADALIALDIAYDSPEAERLAEDLMCTVRETTQAASAALGAERGSFPAFAESVWARRGAGPMRNATTTSNAPNSTIGAIAGCSPGIEPLFAVGYVKELANGDTLREIHPAFLEMARRRGFDAPHLIDEILGGGSVRHRDDVPDDVKRLFGTAHDIDPQWHIRIQAAFQQHTDLGISKTINMPHDASEEDIRLAFLSAHALGCKGITVYRDRCLERQFLSVRRAEAAVDPQCVVCQ